MRLLESDTEQLTKPQLFDDFLQETMKKIIQLHPLSKKTLLAVFYDECHPCTSTIFNSSKDFVQRIATVLDYGLKILPALSQFELFTIVKVGGAYVFEGKNKESHEDESWCFLSKNFKSETELLQQISLFFYSKPNNKIGKLWIYCLEDGDIDCL